MNARPDWCVCGDSPSAPHLDAPLLRLDAELTAAWTVENEAWSCSEYKAEDDDDGPYTLAARACSDLTHRIVDRIERIHARTLDGVLVRLHAVQWCRDGDPISAEDFSFAGTPTTDARLLASLINDLARVRGA